jgi:hypothetical protein
MSVNAVFANMACSDLEASSSWFETLFEREPDARPMDGLCEWHFGETAGFQLHQDATKASQGTLTLIVPDVEAERDRLILAGIDVGDIEEADYTSIARMFDPDENLVVLAQPKR